MIFPILLLILIFFIFKAIFCIFRDKGKYGEKKIAHLLHSTLEQSPSSSPSSTNSTDSLNASLNPDYILLNDVLIPDQIGGTTQIDHIVLSPFGIFVIETKNLTGWIWGNLNSKKWMQQIYSQKYLFYNPIKQNYKHIACLAALTNLPKKYFFPVVVFAGDSTIKTKNKLPDFVTSNQYQMLAYIKSHKQRIIDAHTIKNACAIINSKRHENSKENHQKHISHIHDMLSGQRSRLIPLCPHCGCEMVKRQAKRGKNAGNFFWGCPNYPACRGIVNER